MVLVEEVERRPSLRWVHKGLSTAQLTRRCYWRQYAVWPAASFTPPLNACCEPCESPSNSYAGEFLSAISASLRRIVICAIF